MPKPIKIARVEPGIWRTSRASRRCYFVLVSRRLRTAISSIRPARQGYAPNLVRARKLKLQLLNELNALSPSGAYATFAQAAYDYLDYLRPRRRPSTLLRETSSIKANLLPILGKRLLRELNSQDCQLALDKSSEGRTPQTYKHLRNYLRNIFELARRRGWIRENPAHDTENRPIKRKDPLVLSEAQVRELLIHLRSNHPLMFYHVALAVFTCCRAGELRALTFSDINFENRTIIVSQTLDPQSGRQDRTKNWQSRIVPINPELMELLLELKRLHCKEHSDPVLPYWRPFYDNEQAKELKAVCRKLHLPPIKFHDLRATGITLLLDKGVSVPKVMKLAGHKRLSSTEVYLRLSGVDNRGVTDPMHFGLFSTT